MLYVFLTVLVMDGDYMFMFMFGVLWVLNITA